MIKILFLISELSAGGAEKVLCNLVNNMDQTKFDITVQTIEEGDASKYLIKGIHYKAINRFKSRVGRKIFSYWFRICAELKLAYRIFVKDDYDIEVAYLETAPTKIIAQSTNKKAKKLAWVHCDLSLKEGIYETKNKVKKQYEKFDKIVCVSQDTRKGFHKLFGNDFETVVLHNVIDEDEIFKKADQIIDKNRNLSQIQLLAVGRLTKQKNFSYLIETCRMLRDDGYNFHLDILGEGPERENLEKQIEKLKLTDVIKLQGFIENPYAWMKLSDIIICSSKYEGISTVVQEALILGKPVVTTPCTGMEELLGKSEFGIICGNDYNDLYKSVSDIIKNKEKYKFYKEKAIERGKQFYKYNIVRQTEELFLRN